MLLPCRIVSHPINLTALYPMAKLRGYRGAMAPPIFFFEI